MIEQQKNKALGSFIACFLYVAWLLAELLVEKTLTDTSAYLIMEMQEVDREFLRPLVAQLSNFIPTIPPAILISTMQARISKIDTFFSFSQICMTLVLTSTLKTLFNSSRPFMEFNEIEPILCECSYGDPSFHSSLTAIGYLVLRNDLDNIFKGLKFRPPSTFVKISYDFLMILMLILVTVVRMYSGVHYYGQCVSGFLLSLMVFSVMELGRKSIRLRLYKRYNEVRSNQFSKIWSIFLPLFSFAIFFLFNFWVINVKSRDLTDKEAKNLSRCPDCKAVNIEKTSSLGIIAAYYIPGMILCFSLMSFNKSPKKKQTFTLMKKIVRFLLSIFFKVLTIIPMYFVFRWRNQIDRFTIHLVISLMILVTPSIAFAIPGIFYKKCGLEISTDFIRRVEDPNEDNQRVIVSQYLIGNEKTVEWDVDDLDADLASVTDESDIEGNY